MSFVCPLCRENWIFTARLCVECEKIRHLIATYSLETINSVLEKVLVINKFKQELITNRPSLSPVEVTEIKKPVIEFKKNDKYKKINT
tara:strand:+ start:103 stop:366 length:264 start_codon:yes stop_codon:yes gene_type:complete